MMDDALAKITGNNGDGGDAGADEDRECPICQTSNPGSNAMCSACSFTFPDE